MQETDLNCRSSEHESDEIPNFSILRQFKPQLDQLRNLAQLQSQFVNGHPYTHLTPVSCLYILIREPIFITRTRQ
nr:MAG TPA: hypothetical protein [Caudoviricetes sp.]